MSDNTPAEQALKTIERVMWRRELVEWDAEFSIIRNELGQLRRDALRYRFMRDKDEWPADEDGQEESHWDSLCDLDTGDFDDKVDHLMYISCLENSHDNYGQG